MGVVAAAAALGVALRFGCVTLRVLCLQHSDLFVASQRFHWFSIMMLTEQSGTCCRLSLQRIPRTS